MKSTPLSVSRPSFTLYIGIALLMALVSFPLMAADSPSAVVEVGNGNHWKTYTPKAGETLDKVIQKTLGPSTFSIDILRAAFIDLNPHAFLIGKITKTRPGVTLKVPDLQKLVPSVVEPQSKERVMVQSVSGSDNGAAEERRRWVRYP